MAHDQTLVEHLQAVRTMLFRCVLALAVAFPIGLLVALPGIHWLVGWICPPELASLQALAPFEVFIWQMKIAALIAAVLACPWMVREIWRFIAPGLYENERRAAGWWIGGATILFASGVALCVGFVLPLALRFAAGFQSEKIAMNLRLEEVLGLTLWLARGFGLMFQFPLLILMLVRFGVMRVATLSHARPYVVVVILILAAVLTPPDVISQIALALPTWLLFEAALLLARRLERPQPTEPPAPTPDFGLDLYLREQNSDVNKSDHSIN